MRTTEKISRSSLVEIKVMPVICSWCRKVCDFKKIRIPEKTRTSPSFGICEACARKIRKKIAG